MRDEGERQKSFDELRREYVDGEIERWSDDADAAKHRYSEYRRALDAITRAATDYSISQGLSLDENAEWSLRSILYECCDIITDIRLALYADEGEDKAQMRFWSHRPQPLNELKSNRRRHFRRSEIEACVGRYLALPYRAPDIDRVLVDLLVAMEVFAFGELVLNAPSVPGFGSSSPLKRHPIVEWLANAVLSLVLWIAVAGVLWGLSRIHLFPEIWLTGVNVILGGMVVLSVAWTTILLPRTLWVVHKARMMVLKVLEHMNGVYCELSSDGPISARHIEQRARTAADAGVVWPAPLFALLDDINGRGGRF